VDQSFNFSNCKDTVGPPVRNHWEDWEEMAENLSLGDDALLESYGMMKYRHRKKGRMAATLEEKLHSTTEPLMSATLAAAVLASWAGLKNEKKSDKENANAHEGLNVMMAAVFGGRSTRVYFDYDKDEARCEPHGSFVTAIPMGMGFLFRASPP
jgi:hypothetical protein